MRRREFIGLLGGASRRRTVSCDRRNSSGALSSFSGLNLSAASRFLGVSHSKIFRYAHGRAEIPTATVLLLSAMVDLAIQQVATRVAVAARGQQVRQHLEAMMPARSTSREARW
jgi:hypothetical protein